MSVQLKICVKTQKYHPYYEGTTNNTREFSDLMQANIYYNDCLEIDEKSSGYHFTTIELVCTRK